MHRLAIVILNWNGKSMLQEYLPSVLANSVSDVIVADNASTDGSVEMLHDQFPHTRVIALDKNYGFADGYNMALAQLPEYEYYLLLNNDVEVRQLYWERPLVAYMDSHPNCAACQPKLLSLREPEKFEYAGAAGGFIDRYGYPFCRGRVMDTVEEDKGQYDKIIPLLWATGAALMVRASDWRASGGLDSRFFAHMEEIDLCWRLRIMGKSIVCIPDSAVYHLGGATLSQGSPRKTFLNFRNNRLMLFKNLPDDELISVMRVRSILDYVAALQFFVKGDFANAKAVINAYREYKRIRDRFVPDRLRVQGMSNHNAIPERMPFLLLWKYFACRKKTFSDLCG